MWSFMLSEARASVALDGETQVEVSIPVTLGVSQWQRVIDAIEDSTMVYDNTDHGERLIKELKFLSGLIDQQVVEGLAREAF